MDSPTDAAHDTVPTASTPPHSTEAHGDEPESHPPNSGPSRYAGGMEIKIEDMPFTATKWEVKDAFAQILHGPEFYNPHGHKARPVNFNIDLEPSYNGLPNSGKGKIVIPDGKLAMDFWRWAVRRGAPGIWIRGRKLYLKRSDDKPSRGYIDSLNRTPYVDPKEEEEREKKLDRIGQTRVLLDAVQIGVFFRRSNDQPTANRTFSNEFEIRREDTFVGELVFDYNHKLFRVEMGDYVSEDMSDQIVIDIASILKTAYGSEPNGASYVCLDLWAPPRFERAPRLRTYSGDKKGKKSPFRERLPHLGGWHEKIAQYAYQLRLVLTDHHSRHDIKTLWVEAGIRAPSKVDIGVVSERFFRPTVLEGLRLWMSNFDWPVRFQLEALLRNGLLNTGDLSAIREHVEDLVAKRPRLAGDFLRRFSERLRDKGSGSTVLECLLVAKEGEEKDADSLDEGSEYESPSRAGSIQSAHAIITPSRILLEGPYDTQSNRIVRKYSDFHEYFLRVEFRDENRMAFRWPKEVSGRPLIEQRFGNILKKGVEIAGRRFYFLGYSTSGLREHTAWFMAEFEHPEEGLVTPDKIRTDLGDFSGCINLPSKYAARIAQAFSATYPSVAIRRDQWDIVPDLGIRPYEHTDGQGTISLQLRDMIWDKLREAWHESGDILKPSAFQIRFLGFKGVVVVDEQLEGIAMRLRPSMQKYDAKDSSVAEIEIAKAFMKPGPARLCRPLIAVLEDRGVRKEAFVELQDTAKAKVINATNCIKDTINSLLKQQDLGNTFGLRWILQFLERCGMGMPRTDPKPQYIMDNEFILRLLKCAQTHILRELKHEARIPIENAHQLVGVVDEGPAYIMGGLPAEKVLCLQEGQIFACVEEPDKPDSRRYIKGRVSISRSPHIHPGDVQIVVAIGEPPDDGRICFFRNLKNVVVMPSVGDRSLASCLAGGDVDGDEFLVIKDANLLPTEHTDPALYDADDSVKPRPLDRPSTVEDICDFFVEYMQSDVVGLVADQHLVIADQSKDGTFDHDCMGLAQLCSQAVDYPKNGVPVDVERIPRSRMHAKPDWKKSEDDDGRPGDFYESTRALGELFRNIEIKPLELFAASLPHKGPVGPSLEAPLSDAISAVLRREVSRALGRFHNTAGMLTGLEPLFRYYARELRYICLTHAPAGGGDTRLSEEEIVVGMILTKCAQPRWRKERTYRMREHARQLVRKIKSHRMGFGARFKCQTGGEYKKGRGGWDDALDGEVDEDGEGEVVAAEETDEGASREELVAALEKGWAAWDYGMRHKGVFGARSFGLIGLGVVCEVLGKLARAA